MRYEMQNILAEAHRTRQRFEQQIRSAIDHIDQMHRNRQRIYQAIESASKGAAHATIKELNNRALGVLQHVNINDLQENMAVFSVSK